MKLRIQPVFLLAALICVSAVGAEPGASPPTLYRYLIVLDTSSSMARHKEVAADTLGKLVATGINGRIQTGDLLGVWTIGEKLNPSALGPRMWVDEESGDIGGRVFVLARDAKYSKTANLGLAVSALLEAAQVSGSLTVFLVTDGATPVQGTPFDDAINEVFQGHAAAMKKAKTPFVVVLTAQAGALVSQAISPGGARIYIPPTPKPAIDPALEQELFGIQRPEAKRADQAAAGDTVKTNAVKPLSVAEISEILQKQQAARTNVASDVTPPSAPSDPNATAVTTAATPTELPAAVRPPATEANPAPADSTAAVLTSSIPAKVESSESPPERPATVTAGPDATRVKHASPALDAIPGDTESAPPFQPAATILPQTPAAVGRRYLFMAAGLFAVALILGWLLIRWRRPRSHPSLITRSLRERERP